MYTAYFYNHSIHLPDLPISIILTRLFHELLPKFSGQKRPHNFKLQDLFEVGGLAFFYMTHGDPGSPCQRMSKGWTPSPPKRRSYLGSKPFSVSVSQDPYELCNQTLVALRIPSPLPRIMGI